jgi:hypothetical protein
VSEIKFGSLGSVEIIDAGNDPYEVHAKMTSPGPVSPGSPIYAPCGMTFGGGPSGPSYSDDRCAPSPGAMMPYLP